MDLDPSVVCRLCLQFFSSASMVMLNRNEGLIQAIQHITSVEAILDPDNNVYMCKNCQTLLDQCIQFRTTCLCNDIIFRRMHIKKNRDISKSPETFPKVEVVKIENEFDPMINNIKNELDEDNDFKPEAEVEAYSSEDVKLKDEVIAKSRRKRSRRSKLNQLTDNRSKPKAVSHKVQCQICGKMIANTNLGAHQQTHNPNRPKLVCPHCPMQYTDTKRLKLHINNKHTHEVQYSCDRCGKTFASPDSLRVHYVALHTDIKKYECTLCGEKFSRSTSRRHHYKMVHTTIRPYECEYCERTFKFKCDLTLHTRTHTGEKPFECDICHKTFNKSYNVVIHKKSHQNELERAAEKAMKVVQNVC
ncbi:zinc finger protein 62 homolog isoform X2 [Malaya genurostris]|uniref:zinc finger protein 62 homolog isoform X2 n=1 Tax=Malaya genurostris TaxID=325434 RepID=UPI0026F3883C|nr:zinc finger protein 62 homolog isoform X2 [Malaya genurostris]